MITEWTMLGLQVLCTLESLYHRQTWKALYWFAAVLLTLAVIKGLRQ